MPDLNDESLKKLLGDDPIATSVSVRIRQDEQTLTNLERRFNSIKKEAEGIVKALKEAGVHAGKLGNAGGRGGKTVTNVGSTPVQGGIFTPTPIDRGQGTITGMNQRGQTTTGGGGGGNIFTRAFQATQPNADGTPTIGSTRMAAANETMNAMLASMDARSDRGYQYSLSADRMNMLFQQMKGMSQTAVQDTYRQPLTKYMLGQGGINSLLAMEASTGISASQQARSVEALRVSSGFSVNAQQAASTIEQLASPQVANRMFMMTGMSIVKPGGGYRSMDDLMRNIVKTQGLTDPRLLQGAKAPGSVTRANLSMIGVTGELQNQILQYAEQNLAYKQKGGTGMYDPANKEHQKIMGIDQNFALQKEKTDQLRVEREEQFYSRQADNFADLERQTQSLVRTLAALEDKISGIFGTRISTRVSANVLSRIGNSLLPGGLGDTLGKGVGTILGLFGSGDFVSADMAERQSKSSSGTGKGTFSNLVSKGKSIASGGGKTGSAKLGVSAGISKPMSFGINENSNISKSIMNRNKQRSGPPESPALWAEFGLATTPSMLRGEMMTAAELGKSKEILNMNPDFANPLLKMIEDFHKETGFTMGVQSGYRSTADQQAMWSERMEVDPKQSPGSILHQGQYWKKKSPDLADVAPPGAPYSNHEHGLAADLRSNNPRVMYEWLEKNAHRYGMEWFGNVNNEPWHVQLGGLRERGSGGGAGYNERDKFSVPGIGLKGEVTQKTLQSALNAVGLGSIAYSMQGKSNVKYSDLWDPKNPISGISDFGKVLSQKSLGVGFGFSLSGMGSQESANRSLINKLSTGTGTKPGTAAISYGVDSKGVMSDEALMTLLYNTGFRGNDLVDAFAIAKRESGGKPGATNFNNELSYGLFQHNMDPNTTSDAQNRAAWGLEDNNQLLDPATNARIAFEKMNWLRAHGESGWEPWGPYKGVSHLHKTNVKASAAMAQQLGYISKYEGDYVPTSRKSPEYVPSLQTQVGGYEGSAYGGGMTAVREPITSNNITVAPTININTSGGNLDQDLERMARKVASMLEQEVNRTMMRRN